MGVASSTVFGNSAAEHDPLLYECPVNPDTPDSLKPILTGRWGTGKSALILLAGRQQSESLQAVDHHLARAWYITERGIDVAALTAFQATLSGDHPRHLVRTLESVWRAHVIRAHCRTLEALARTEGRWRGDHWAFVERVAQQGDTAGTIWSQLGRVVTLITGDTERQKALSSIQDAMEALLHRGAITMVDDCLRDLARDGKAPPVVAVEPIETPSSDFETGASSLATPLVTSLLNVFMNYFQPGGDAHFDVRIALPWHRYDPAALDFPQKVRQYVGRLRWSRSRLREFIDKRVQWEFRRVGRRFVARTGWDAWNELFGATIANGICLPRVQEDTFGYFLRHTHHRARDLQTLARRAVEAQADADGVSVDHVLRTAAPLRPGVIKEIFRRENPEATRELLIEAGRKYPKIHTLAEQLRGLAIPFAMEKLKERAERGGVDVNQALDVLWHAGVVGVTAVPVSERAVSHLIAVLSEDAHMIFENENHERRDRWTWFEYNLEGTPTKLIEALRGLAEVEWGLVLHSKALEFFAPHSFDRSCPTGI